MPSAGAAPPITPHTGPDPGPPILYALALLLAGALLSYLLALALRPVRRAVTLRHLRRPFWSETIDQRISNSWQLALVGLRDAGFCAHAGEQPEELARRARVDGIGDCASVLERARHGLGVDDGDLATMADAAELAYRAARTRLSIFARAAASLRWPLA
jgi:hypothetical protein